MRRTLTLSMLMTLLMIAGRQVGAATLDETVAPGHNYDKAEFRLWYPDTAGPFQAIVVLVPGSNGDGRARIGIVEALEREERVSRRLQVEDGPTDW